MVPVAVHDVRVAVSANGGKTWYPLRVSGSGSQWSVTVTDSGNADYVSLRISAADAGGTSVSVVVFRAEVHANSGGGTPATAARQ